MTGDDLRDFCERNPGIDDVCRHKLLQAAVALDAAQDVREMTSAQLERLIRTAAAELQRREGGETQ